MGIKIKPEVIREKLVDYIRRLEELKRISYSQGKDKMYSVDANIKSFLRVAFEDPKERNRDYQGIAIAISNLPPEKEQEFYLSDITSRIRTLEAWKGEMELIIETNECSLNIEKVESRKEIPSGININVNPTFQQSQHQYQSQSQSVDIEQLIDELEGELKKPKPDKSKLRTIIEKVLKFGKEYSSVILELLLKYWHI